MIWKETFEHFLMAANFHIQYCLDETETKRICQNICVKFYIFWFDTTFMKKQFHYCIHCGYVFGRSGFHSHKQTFTLEPEHVRFLEADFFINNEKHTGFIRKDFEYRFETGKMWGVGVPINPSQQVQFTPLHLRTPSQDWRSFPAETPPGDQSRPPPPPIHDYIPPPDNHYEHAQESYPHLFDCLSVDGFDRAQFEQFIRNNCSLFDETSGNDHLIVQKEKARMISVLAHNLYMMCTLSKNQMKQITAFWKAMIAFISPEAGAIANKIHVSYSSCLREAKRRSDETQARHHEMFRNCMYFSLALDTAQFGLDHHISCVVRFGFDDKIQQENLFFEKVSETTGHGLARFVFMKLLEKQCDFSKLVSITTDGAKNMISQQRGLASEIVQMANNQLGTTKRIGVDVHCLWCIDHRLNLVARDFNKVPNINFEILSIDWITAKDRLVSYTAFVKANRETSKKKIPPPSDIRWLFYRDALVALLEQTQEVDAFLNQNRR